MNRETKDVLIKGVEEVQKEVFNRTLVSDRTGGLNFNTGTPGVGKRLCVKEKDIVNCNRE